MTGIATTAYYGKTTLWKQAQLHILYPLSTTYCGTIRSILFHLPPPPLNHYTYYDNNEAFCDFESNFFFLILPRLTFSDQH